MERTLESVVYIALAFALCYAGKLLYPRFHGRLELDRELTARDNLALAVPLGSYYLAIMIVMGGPLSGIGEGHFLKELLLTALWGAAALFLLLVSQKIMARALFPGISLDDEIVKKENAAAGILTGAAYLSSALLLLGATAGDRNAAVSFIFWAVALGLEIGAVMLFLKAAKYRMKEEILRCNNALALSVGGMLISIALIMKMSVTGEFPGWAAAFGGTLFYALSGTVLLYAVMNLVDWILLPGVTITGELIEQKIPNTGVGALTGLFYIGVSFLVIWVL